MIDSDITGNITAACHQLPQEMIETHDAACQCDRCCNSLTRIARKTPISAQKLSNHQYGGRK